ncbi:endonuclease MutS2 [Urechidicola croceus]|uniref:DNA mismatch repair protein MutS n=1 Tax=Urechidicola croceus TaxID=1850246 RepID=A0A1D8P5X3_9FLAO|nr:DNA mismatch repair protein MutS [Urechidicola croceus]AOW19937.1 DNA mismatch repair protein MutS [Urechidicola croceus]
MANKISEKTLNDLEFNTILSRIHTYCISDLGRKASQQIKPISENKLLLSELKKVDEYLTSFENDNRIPNHFFEEITKEISLFEIENSYLTPESFLKIASVSETVNELLKFLKKFKEIYPILFDATWEIEYTTEIVDSIQKIITPFGEVDDKASINLKRLRKEIHQVRNDINESFNHALSKFNSSGYLDDIRESVIENQRVLAVIPMHKRKVKGTLLGTSKTGSIVFIAPQATLKYARELENLLFEEKQEIILILKTLTNDLRIFKPLLIDYQTYLTQLDLIGAKAKYANNINAVLPKIAVEKKIILKDAYHPILLEKNRENSIKTIPQSIELNEKQQIIVISGPNAGGKSITLKTIGLLQVMIQSAILIPVDEKSEISIFDRILTDIGDNQSIENQLSTYSYRLKNMRQFLQKCNSNTLFLIDEFGTGSDPELGGALAEIFLEEFYEKKAYGIITTHYANLKVLADELENVSNANMQFDERTLEPLFKLFIGQAGSSFTFEVAQKNGIPYSLINRAKKKVEGEKIRLDKTISKLQKERNKLQKTSEILEQEQSKAKEQTENLSGKEEKIQKKLELFQELYDSNQKMLVTGRKINELVNKYFQTNNKKELIAEFTKWATIERTKYLKKNPPIKKSKPQKKQEKVAKKVQAEKIQKIEKEILVEVEKVREIKKVEAIKIAKQKADYKYKINDKVRLIDGKSSGTIEKIEKNNVTINFGIFTTKTSLNKIELVQASK